MKKLSLLILLFITVFTYGQEDKMDVAYSENMNTRVTSLKISSSSIKELQEINWDDMKSIFESNEPDQIIKLTIELDLKDSKDKFKTALTTSGKVKEIDTVIKNAKKILKSLLKMSKKYDN